MSAAGPDQALTTADVDAFDRDPDAFLAHVDRAVRLAVPPGWSVLQTAPLRVDPDDNYAWLTGALARAEAEKGSGRWLVEEPHGRGSITLDFVIHAATAPLGVTVEHGNHDGFGTIGRPRKGTAFAVDALRARPLVALLRGVFAAEEPNESGYT